MCWKWGYYSLERSHWYLTCWPQITKSAIVLVPCFMFQAMRRLAAHFLTMNTWMTLQPRETLRRQYVATNVIKGDPELIIKTTWQQKKGNCRTLPALWLPCGITLGECQNATQNNVIWKRSPYSSRKVTGDCNLLLPHLLSASLSGDPCPQLRKKNQWIWTIFVVLVSG